LRASVCSDSNHSIKGTLPSSSRYNRTSVTGIEANLLFWFARPTGRCVPATIVRNIPNNVKTNQQACLAGGLVDAGGDRRHLMGQRRQSMRKAVLMHCATLCCHPSRRANGRCLEAACAVGSRSTAIYAIWPGDSARMHLPLLRTYYTTCVTAARGERLRLRQLASGLERAQLGTSQAGRRFALTYPTAIT